MTALHSDALGELALLLAHAGLEPDRIAYWREQLAPQIDAHGTVRRVDGLPLAGGLEEAARLIQEAERRQTHDVAPETPTPPAPSLGDLRQRLEALRAAGAAGHVRSVQDLHDRMRSPLDRISDKGA